MEIATYDMSSASKPSSLAEFMDSIKELTDDTIVNVRSALETSLAKLRETNDYLNHELSTSVDDSDRLLYEETVAENNGVIASQQQKLKAVKDELQSRNLLPEEKGKEEIEEEGGVYL
ncbi:hypothetical protein OXX79_010380 [Metschnikowia pulcherrima]